VDGFAEGKQFSPAFAVHCALAATQNMIAVVAISAASGDNIIAPAKFSVF
jgi:hypothetical protein